MLRLREARVRAERRARWLSLGFFGLLSSVCGAPLAARARHTPAVIEPLSATKREAAVQASSASEPPHAEPAAAPPPATDWPENQLDPQSASAILAASTISSVVVPSAEPVPSARVLGSSELLGALHATPVSGFSTARCQQGERARRSFRDGGESAVEHDIDAHARAAVARRANGEVTPSIDGEGREPAGAERRASVTATTLSVASVPARDC